MRQISFLYRIASIHYLSWCPFPRSAATYFDNPNFDNYDDVSFELKSAGYIKTDIIGGATLSDSAIILFENMTKDAFLSFVDIATKFIP